MGKLLNYKVIIISVLIALLMIPLSMIDGVISERTQYRDQAHRDIAVSWTGSQKLLGPLLVIPYNEKHTHEVWDAHLKNYKKESYTSKENLYLLPEKVNITAKMTTENRNRGLYSVPVYSSDLHLEGAFNTQPFVELMRRKSGRISLGDVYLSVVVNDIRGVVVQPQLEWDGQKNPFVSGSGIPNLEGGMHALLKSLSSTSAEHPTFRFDMTLHGMETIEFAPVGNSTQVSMESTWPHPSFIGRYLPNRHTITDKSFTAEWRASSFSSDMPRIIHECEAGRCDEFSNNTFGVSLVNPVDLYQQTERAVKYAILFIVLTFVAFFLFEVMKRLRLHPMQYLLVGCALTVFYLLLISLSEHMVFIWAYVISALASTLLIGIYVSGILASWQRGMMLAGGLLVLYGMLYAILQSEDNALLMGSLLIFAVLGSVMLVTRRLDWYRIGGQSVADAAGSEK